MGRSLQRYTVGDQAYAPNDDRVTVEFAYHHDGAWRYRVRHPSGITGIWPEADLEPVAPPARPVVDAADVDLLIDALGHYAGSLADSGRNPAEAARAAGLQRRLRANRTSLRQVMAGLAPALTMTTD
jgi:hypothetical protein